MICHTHPGLVPVQPNLQTWCLHHHMDSSAALNGLLTISSSLAAWFFFPSELGRGKKHMAASHASALFARKGPL